jgi:hypothetical protein
MTRITLRTISEADEKEVCFHCVLLAIFKIFLVMPVYDKMYNLGYHTFEMKPEHENTTDLLIVSLSFD